MVAASKLEESTLRRDPDRHVHVTVTFWTVHWSTHVHVGQLFVALETSKHDLVALGLCVCHP